MLWQEKNHLSQNSWYLRLLCIKNFYRVIFENYQNIILWKIIPWKFMLVQAWLKVLKKLSDLWYEVNLRRYPWQKRLWLAFSQPWWQVTWNDMLYFPSPVLSLFIRFWTTINISDVSSLSLRPLAHPNQILIKPAHPRSRYQKFLFYCYYHR